MQRTASYAAVISCCQRIDSKASMIKATGSADEILDGRCLLVGHLNFGLGKQFDDLVAGQIRDQ